MPASVGAFILPSLAGTLTASVVGGAIVGAAIGGITAAITGGDIGKGLLFGAVGGAVTGAISYGLGSVMESMKLSSQVNWASGETVGGIPKEALTNQMSITSANATGGVPNLIPEGAKVVTEAGQAAGKSGFLSSLGKSLGAGFGQAAIGAGIGGIKDVYLAKKAGELQMSEAEKNRELEREKLRSAEARASMSGGGGGSGGSGPDYTIDELIRRDKMAAQEERTSILAKVDAELNAQKALRRQEYAEAGAGRERASAGARVGTGSRGGSRSTETLVDVQNRIRAGEDAQGNPNTGVIPPVKYVPPGQAVPEEQVA